MGKQVICDKCKHEIKRGIRTDGKVNPSYSILELKSFTGAGGHRYTKEFYLCEKCQNKFINFLLYNEHSYSHVDTVNNQSSKQYTDVAYDSNKYYYNDKTVLIGKNSNTNNAISNSVQIGVGLNGIKSIAKCGNWYLYTTKVFNKFQKKMWKKFFGINIEEIQK